jgi:replicative DNA helicase
MAALQSLDQYGISFQVKVISSLLNNKEFLVTISELLNPEDFNNSAHRWIVQEVIKYYNKYHTYPSMDVLKVELKKLENEVLKLAIKEQLKEAYKSSEGDLEYVTEEFSNFCRNQQLKKALLNSVDLMQTGDYDSIRILIDNALKAGQTKDIGHIYDKDVESRYREDDRNAIPFPWPEFNDVTQGGYGKGDLILIFGNPGGGKSWSIVAMAAEAARSGRNVVYYALELGEGYVGKRFDAYFTGIPVNEIDQHRDKVEAIMATIPGKIIIKEYPPKRASLSTIESHLRQLRDYEDIEVDAVFIDYLDLLKNRTSRKEKKDDIDDVYTDAKGLAKEMGIPFISPSQANRTGADKEILESSHIAGSYDKIMIGDIVISLARGRKDRLAGTGRWHFMKNRYGMDGMTFSSQIDTSVGHIQILEQLDDDDISALQKQSKEGNKKVSEFSNINNIDREYLSRQFFKLENEQQ